MQVLFKFFESYKIFKKLGLSHYDYHQKEQFYKRLKLIKHTKGQVVFDYLDDADYFYIIVKGRVSVQIPTTVRKHFTEQEFIDYLHKNDIASVFSNNKDHTVSQVAIDTVVI